jgi:hypothetical protein
MTSALGLLSSGVAETYIGDFAKATLGRAPQLLRARSNGHGGSWMVTISHRPKAKSPHLQGLGRDMRHDVAGNPLDLTSLVTDSPKEEALTPCPYVAGQQLRTLLRRPDADAGTELGRIPLHERSKYLGQDPFRLSPFVGDKGPHRNESVRKVIAGPALFLQLLAQDRRIYRKLLWSGVIRRREPAIG